jgi:Tfp pilus assembly protein PilZ
MSKKSDQEDFSTTRSSPRAVAALDVEVEVAGERHRVRLVSQDIGAGGIFLRTDKPAALWTKVKLVLTLPAGGTFEVGGEVVRSVPKDKARSKSQPAGMAVAFDEVSRRKRKELVALVLDLCARRPEKVEKKEVAPATPAPPKKTAVLEPEKANQDRSTDELLEELDELLDSVEGEIETETEAESKDKTAGEEGEEEEEEEEEEIVIEDVEVIDLESPAEETAGEETEPKIEPAPAAGNKGSVEDLQAILSEYKSALKGDTYYDILGIDMKASTTDIEAAYQQLLGRLKPPGSPDSLPGDLLRELSSVLGKIRKAFAILSKPDRKRAYDFLIDNEVDDF